MNDTMKTTATLGKSGNAGVKDLVALKMQKKLIEAQLAQVKTETKKLNAIVDRKTRNKQSSLYKDAPPIETTIKIQGDVTLADLRPVHRGCKVLPKPPPKDLDDIEPSPIPMGSNLERIRHQHIRRTIGKVEIRKLNHAKAEKIAKKEEKTRLKPAGIKIAASMFPNRYVRGELPCTIEHGVRGNVYFVPSKLFHIVSLLQGYI
jgi:hypothetical protein